MKKLILIFAILLSCALTAIQGQNPILMYDYATLTTPLGRSLQNGNMIWIRSTGAIYQLTKDFGSTATPASIIVDGHYRAYAYISTGLVTLSPLTTGTGTVGTSSLRFGTGYINTLVGNVTGTVTGHSSLDELTTNKTNATSTSATLFPTWNAAKAYADSIAALLARIASPTFTTQIVTPLATITSADTTSATAAVGTIFMRLNGSDTSMWLLIRKTGTIHARWKKLSN